MKEMLVKGNYDVMTLDIGLPDKNGIELINELRATEATKDLPIVVVSVASSDNYEDQFDASVFKIVDCLTKPIDKDALYNAITHAVVSATNNYSRILHVEDDGDIL